MMLTRLFAAVPCLALCAAASGCIIVDDSQPQPAAGYGMLSVYWTLDGSASPSICSYYGVDRVDVALYDANGDHVIDAQPYCEDFGVSFDRVADAGYDVEVTLLDAAGSPLSDLVILPVDVWADEETVVDIDFPDASIY